MEKKYIIGSILFALLAVVGFVMMILGSEEGCSPPAWSIPFGGAFAVIGALSSIFMAFAGATRGDVLGVRAELRELRGDVRGLRDEIRSMRDELRDEIRSVGKGVEDISTTLKEHTDILKEIRDSLRRRKS